MGLLFFNEFLNYNSTKQSSRMFVDVERNSEKLVINLDVDMFSLPCSILSIDIEDALGASFQVVEGNLTISRLNKNGNIISSSLYNPESLGRFGHEHDHLAQPNFNETKKQLLDKEGCKLKGSFMVDGVPGSFLISTKSYISTVDRLIREGVPKVNLDHKIHHLSFGEHNKKRLNIKRGFGNLFGGLEMPLNGMIKRTEKVDRVFQYYLKVVPSKYINLNEQTTNSYQYTYNSNEIDSFGGMSKLYFKYDISPITVEYKAYKMTFLNFFINICAILGGIFTVTGIIDAIIHKSVVILLRKAEVHKLA